MVTGADDGGGAHACVSPTSSSRADDSALSSDPVSYISLFKKTIIVTDLTNISMPIANVSQQ
jgi:hypothetical protein